jgi:hypothetical protein
VLNYISEKFEVIAKKCSKLCISRENEVTPLPKNIDESSMSPGKVIKIGTEND